MGQTDSSKMMDAQTSSLTASESNFLATIGDLVEQWGFKRHLGRIWALLYLRREPLTHKDIQTELELSAGSVNALLSELLTWGAIKRVRVPGDRQFYFEPQTEIWRSLSNVFKSRELRILEEASIGLKELKEEMRNGDDPKLAEFRARRIEHIESVLETGLSLAQLLVNQPPERLAKVGKLVSKLRKM